MYTRSTAGDASGGARGTAGAPPAWRSRIRLIHTLAHPELAGTSLTCLRFHPRPERLVVFGRDNCLWVFSLLRYELKARLTGIPCAHHALKCAVSPDGAFVVAGGEDGAAHVFDLNSCQMVHAIDVGYRAPLYDVSWHPTQHALALASFGGDYPIKVLEYRAGAPQPAPASPTQEEEEQAALAALQAQRTAASTLALGGTNAPLPPSLKVQAASASAIASFQGGGATPSGAAGPPLASSMRRGQSLAGTRANPLPPIPVAGGETMGASIGRPVLQHASTLGSAKHVTFGGAP